MEINSTLRIYNDYGALVDFLERIRQVGRNLFHGRKVTESERGRLETLSSD